LLKHVPEKEGESDTGNWKTNRKRAARLGKKRGERVDRKTCRSNSARATEKEGKKEGANSEGKEGEVHAKLRARIGYERKREKRSSDAGEQTQEGTGGDRFTGRAGGGETTSVAGCRADPLKKIRNHKLGGEGRAGGKSGKKHQAALSETQRRTARGRGLLDPAHRRERKGT